MTTLLWVFVTKIPSLGANMSAMVTILIIYQWRVVHSALGGLVCRDAPSTCTVCLGALHNKFARCGVCQLLHRCIKGEHAPWLGF
jgi:putative component of membrane protein insertase Oxa1/YidC/SpoIIIJ protein YidD